MKKPLKELMLGKRDSLSRDEIKRRSRLIRKNLFSLPEYKKAGSVMFFVSFNSEVHTHGMIQEALKSKTVIVPKVVHRSRHGIRDARIIPCIIESFGEMKLTESKTLVPKPETLRPSRFGILEPERCITPKSIDVVLVPATAFDIKGHRIGYGLGLYDRFLKTPLAICAAKVGLAFDFQLVKSIIHEEHDVPVDIIVTEGRIIKKAKKRD